ncbi:unnamed protein product, partial [Soboliphyme baturini]|uniref:PIP49_C domain-containing protein n=1 Tax=Soboliphyme baturini TaxID=241478 RepID=A0A183J8A6_9BILA
PREDYVIKCFYFLFIYLLRRSILYLSHNYVLTSHYNNGFASGDLCMLLCFEPDHKILEFHSTNKAVIGVNLAGQRLLLKSSDRYFLSYDMLPSTISEEKYLDAVVNMVNFHMAFGWPRNKAHHLLNEIWPSYKRSHKITIADRRSIWTLVNQEEFLNFKLLNYLQVFPKVIGTCGHMYAVEFIPPLDSNLYFHGPKYRAVHKSMGTLKILQDSLNEAVHMCDVKRENFGESVAYPNRLMVLDGDMVFTDSRLNALFHSLRCKSDTDCTFFSCTANCNQTTGYCSRRHNSNFEVSVTYFDSFYCRVLFANILNEFLGINLGKGCQKALFSYSLKFARCSRNILFNFFTVSAIFINDLHLHLHTVIL